jgi:hypothetical protein
VRLPFLVAIGFLVLAFAGCSGAPSAAKQTPGASIDAGQGKGRIVGLVLTIEQLPIPEAAIRIFPKTDAAAPAVTLVTDAGGKFDAQGLPEGAYILYATKPGFKDLLPLNIDVAAGATSNVVVTMQEAKTLVAFHESFSRTISFPVWACVIAPVPVDCTGAFNPGNLSTPVKNDEEQTGPLASLIVEGTWTRNVPVCANGLQHHVFSPEQKDLDPTYVANNKKYWAVTNPFHWTNVPDATKNPTRLMIQREGSPLAMLSPERSTLNGGKPIQIGGEWKVQSWPYSAKGGVGTPVDVDCWLNQTATLWVSAFFVAPAPNDWSVLKSG